MNIYFKIRSKHDGLNLSVLERHETTDPKAVILFIHGLYGRKERQIDTIKYFASQGYSCVGFDLRGHGESVRDEKDLGYTYRGGAEAMADDIDSVMEWIVKKFPGLPIIMIAHSMGSLAARTYIKRGNSPVKGVILCGSPSHNPFCSIGIALLKALCLVRDGRMRLTFLQKIIDNSYNKRFRAEGERAWTCSDPAERERFTKDSKCSIAGTADCQLTLLEMMNETYSKKGWHVTNPSLHVRFLSGEDDPCMISRKKWEKAAGFMKSLGYTDVTGQLYPGIRHEILNEIGKEKVWEDIDAFIQESCLDS